jgi:hypothetical protein
MSLDGAMMIYKKQHEEMLMSLGEAILVYKQQQDTQERQERKRKDTLTPTPYLPRPYHEFMGSTQQVRKPFL